MTQRVPLVLYGTKEKPLAPGDTLLGSGLTEVQELLPLAATFTDGYVDLTNTPTSSGSLKVFIFSGNAGSSLQRLTVDYNLVRDSNGGNLKRIAWDSTSVPGSSTAIPDGSDLAASTGMQDVLTMSDALLIYYTI